MYTVKQGSSNSAVVRTLVTVLYMLKLYLFRKHIRAQALHFLKYSLSTWFYFHSDQFPAYTAVHELKVTRSTSHVTHSTSSPPTNGFWD